MPYPEFGPLNVQVQFLSHQSKCFSCIELRTMEMGAAFFEE